MIEYHFLPRFCPPPPAAVCSGAGFSDALFIIQRRAFTDLWAIEGWP